MGVEDLVEALKTDGALIFIGLGEEYSAALGNLNKRAPYCLDGLGLTVEMDDGSERLTVARDTLGATGPFPDCVRNEAEVVGDAFDRVDKLFSQLMRKQFGADLDVVEEENNKTKVWEEFNTKTHLHVYRRSNKMTTSHWPCPTTRTTGCTCCSPPPPSFPSAPSPRVKRSTCSTRTTPTAPRIGRTPVNTNEYAWMSL